MKTCLICDLTGGLSDSREVVMASGCLITGGGVICADNQAVLEPEGHTASVVGKADVWI